MCAAMGDVNFKNSKSLNIKPTLAPLGLAHTAIDIPQRVVTFTGTSPDRHHSQHLHSLRHRHWHLLRSGEVSTSAVRAVRACTTVRVPWRHVGPQDVAGAHSWRPGRGTWNLAASAAKWCSYAASEAAFISSRPSCDWPVRNL